MRAVLERGLLNEALPLKLSYITSCFRYEKPQAGRLREFHQFGVEMLGSASPAADAEVIGVADEIFRTLGVKGLELQINSIGCPECRGKYHEALKAYFEARKGEMCIRDRVGVVTEVGAYYSKVTTILSPEVKVGAVHPDTGEVGTVSGTVALAEQGACQLSYLEEDSQIKKGDLIVTSGASGLFPKNIVIGLAGELQTAEHGISSYTTVTPVFDIKSVSQVFVVTDFDGKSQEGENG